MPWSGNSPNVAPLTDISDFLKERLFGLSNPQGNHGESVKEAHFHLDNTPVSPCPGHRASLVQNAIAC